MLNQLEILVNYLKKVKDFSTKYKIIGVLCFVFFAMLIVGLPKAFAQPQPVRSVEIFSEKADYNNKEPGAWKVTKSAKWLEKGVAEITLDVGTTLVPSENNLDVLFVVDSSDSMYGNRMNYLKESLSGVVEKILSVSDNKVGLITFDSTSTIVSDFTNDKDSLVDRIEGFYGSGNRNYYRSLLNVNNVLKNYQKKENRECIVAFVVNGEPNVEIPTGNSYYEYLKNEYPFVVFNGIQYDTYNNTKIVNLEKVSDKQYFATIKNLNDVLFNASFITEIYETFEVTDYINTDYFVVEKNSNIKVSEGDITFDKNNQKIKWAMSDLKSGSKAKMTINAKLKNAFGSGELYSTNNQENIISKIRNISEDVLSSATPILADKYSVSYDVNTPDGCTVDVMPNTSSETVFDIIKISDIVPKCDEYQFKGWDILNKDVQKINEDYFIIPEEEVVFRAKWNKLSLKKLMDGEVQEYEAPVLQKIGGEDYNGELWQYKESITKVIFQNEIKDVPGVTESFDISAEKNKSIMGYIVPNKNNTSTYTAYIQAYKKIMANEDSSYLFAYFKNLKEIEGLEYLNTSNVKSMRHMFEKCSSLTTLDLSNFKTSNVVYFNHMFRECTNLVNLNLSSFDTSNVIVLDWMFYNCSSLTSLDLSNFNTSKVTTMPLLFHGCSSLTSLNLSNLDTSRVTDMSLMFYECSSLTSLDVSHFDTSKVTNMKSMFNTCSSLTSLDVSNFDTSNVTNMLCMFNVCISLTSLDLSKFNTAKVTDMGWMFSNCSNLTSLNLSNFNTLNVAIIEGLFYGCSKLITTIKISNPNITSYGSMFYGAATAAGTKITVNYVSSASNLVNQMIATKSSNSNVVKGNLITV